MFTLPIKGLLNLEVPLTSRLLKLSDSDRDLLELFDWTLTVPSVERFRLQPDSRLVSVRAHLAGFYFYPHHLVLASISSTSAILVAKRATPGELYSFISPYRLSGCRFLNGDKTDVRRENLGSTRSVASMTEEEFKQSADVPFNNHPDMVVEPEPEQSGDIDLHKLFE